MPGIQKAKRTEATRKILVAAVTCVERNGLDALHARDIATEAGYSVGLVYKYYEDLDDIIIAVNSMTLGLLRDRMQQATLPIEDPVAKLKALALTYLDFSLDNKNLWAALFGHRLPAGKEIPKWHKDENVALLSFIGEALHDLDPEMTTNTLEARTRTYFAAVHGVVTVSHEQRFVGLSGETLRSELDFLVDRLAG